MEYHGGVLSGLHDLVEIADRAVAHCTCQWPVHPLGLAAMQQVPTDEVGGGQVVVAQTRDERTVEVVPHRLDETSLAASRRALQHDGQPLAVCRLEHLLLVRDGHVVRARRLHRHRFPSLRTAVTTDSRGTDVWFKFAANLRPPPARVGGSYRRAEKRTDVVGELR